ncbi:calcineurin responsive transcription factor prz1 [Gigaspora margarita]|uniref:Calcineurin responsive transcription factor prz1 n=1 Tax=Gigaspora margarita TaxID=4874 RepID=A0A8H3X156_GIGMA|nr:calcineurin responsive transcription factor prz1 [Gigaspora margarita]
MNSIAFQPYHQSTTDSEYNFSLNQKDIISSDEFFNQFFSAETIEFQPEQQPFDIYYCQQFPSYGSPEISEYEPSSDGYSSCPSVISSPNLPTETMFYQDNSDSFDYPPDSLYQDMTLDTFPYQSLDMMTCSDPSSIGDLKLNISCVGQSDNSADLLSIPQNTFDQSVMFNFVPATPLSPSKSSTLLPYNSDMNPQPIQSANDVQSSMPVANTQIGNAEQQNKQKSPSKKTDSSSSRTKVAHRSHRRSLPIGMVERLHTMNLAPPKPSRKSKTCSPFSCPYEDCTKTFTRQYNLKSHLRTHTDERPFLCGYQGCMRAFARQHDRKRHYNLHLGFKPHVCSHCGRAFARLDALNRHLRSDSGAPCAQAALPNTGAKKFKPISM